MVSGRTHNKGMNLASQLVRGAWLCSASSRSGMRRGPSPHQAGLQIDLGVRGVALWEGAGETKPCTRSSPSTGEAFAAWSQLASSRRSNTRWVEASVNCLIWLLAHPLAVYWLLVWRAPARMELARYPSAEDLAKFYRSEGANIFGQSTRWTGRLSAWATQWFRPKYSDSGLVSSLRQYFGDTMLSQASVHTVVTSYRLSFPRGIELFSSEKSKTEGFDLPMWVVARGTTAAPTYFAPARTSLVGSLPLARLLTEECMQTTPPSWLSSMLLSEALVLIA